MAEKLPTLLVKGNIIPQPDDNAEELAKLVPLKYIINWFDKRIPMRYGGMPLKRAQEPGDKILILRSETASGKSTVFPPELYHQFYGRTRKNIAVTQPRILTAVEIPSTIIPFHTKERLKAQKSHTDRRPLILGDNIGYQTGAISKKPIRGLIYMTVGTLTQQLTIMSEEDFMKKYSFIIIDEVHERSVETDLALFMMKKFIHKNYKKLHCPFLVLTSATFNVQKFANYFETTNIIEVKGASYMIHENYLQYSSSNYFKSVVDTVRQIHISNRNDYLSTTVIKNRRSSSTNTVRDILVFVSGSKEIDSLMGAINKLNIEFVKEPLLPIALTGSIFKAQTANYQNIYKPLNQIKVEINLPEKRITRVTPVRRVIISTNVAETGVTIDTLKYVIDTGWYNSAEYNPSYAVNALIHKPVTKGMARQRRGRSGRVAEGYWYPLYTREIYDSMMDDQFPGIIKDEITLTLLNLLIKEYDLFDLTLTEQIEKIETQETIDIGKIDLLDYPPADAIHRSIEKMYILGAIDYNTKPTPLGLLMYKFRKISFESIKMILSGYAWGTSIRDLITIAAFLPYKHISYYNISKSGIKSERNQLLIADDFIQPLLFYYDFAEKISNANFSLEKIKDWLEKNKINYSQLMEILELRDEIIEILSISGLNPFANESKSLSYGINLEKIKKIKHCIYEGYKLNLAIWDQNHKKYVMKQSHLRLQIRQPSDLVLSFKNLEIQGDTNPLYVIFDKATLFLNEKKNMYNAVVNKIAVMDGFVPLNNDL